MSNKNVFDVTNKQSAICNLQSLQPSIFNLHGFQVRNGEYHTEIQKFTLMGIG
jgi:hypothetical protein